MRFVSLYWGLSILFMPICASAVVIDFDDLAHGTIVDDEYFLTPGVTISAVNIGGGPDIAAAFDTTLTGTRDPDLEDAWSGGNLLSNTNLGRILIIQENNIDRNNDGVLDEPDDEGSRPAGTLHFQFGAAIDRFGFDLIDVEGPTEYGADSGYFAAFYTDGTQVGQVGFGDLVDPASSFYDSTIVYGNNYINHINEIFATDLGVTSFDEVKINFGGSAGIDNINFQFTTVPEPGTLALLGLGLAGIGFLRRKKAA